MNESCDLARAASRRPEVSDIVVIPIVPSAQITVPDVWWEGAELRLGIHVETDAENAPILDEARRLTAMTTTASGSIG